MPAKPEPAHFAAIDIGSNAIRLLVAAAAADTLCPRKILLFRMPLRLGAEAFATGRLSAATVERLMDILAGFSLLLRAIDIVSVRVCATSAMRDAANREQIVAAAQARCQLQLEVLDGPQEVALLCANFRDQPGLALAIDVGGGSTELALMDGGVPLAMQSFDVGAVRALAPHPVAANGGIAAMMAWLDRCVGRRPELAAFASGGNIRKIGKLAGDRDRRRVDRASLAELVDALAATDMDERRRRWHMTADRADAILPASRIFLAILERIDCAALWVARLGLADAMVREMAERHFGVGRVGHGGDLHRADGLR